ncbi:MAG: hypothetical protein KR126chlam3_00902 [Chlamydiae bacterium]|nr:hypothetical protein [Chlamydiota bacterium]
MIKEQLASIISFCTHDLRFLDRCIQGISPFSSQIIIPVCDHFYNGKPEDLDLLGKIYAKYPQVDFIEFAYSEEEVYGTPARLVKGAPGWGQHWHNSARLVGSYFVRPEIQYVLFLDVDEIFSGGFEVEDYEAIRFATYWYFKRADNCASVFPDGPLLVKKCLLTPELLINEDERAGMFWKIKGKKVREYLGNEGPLVHHYSWVRTREECLAKVRSWGHHWERDWENMIDREDDFVRGYSYRQVEPFWNPLEEKVELSNEKKSPLCKVTPKDIFRLEMAQLIKN